MFRNYFVINTGKLHPVAKFVFDTNSIHHTTFTYFI